MFGCRWGCVYQKRVERIVREEMEKIDSQELLMPVTQPGELWHESGRWEDYGAEL